VLGKPPTPVLDKALRRRVALNTVDGETLFTGRLVEYDAETFVLEQCETIPAPGETARPIKGRQYVDRIHGFLTELPT
jgi:small nuclear ribonucleoprotein (snRNP)-like protein